MKIYDAVKFRLAQEAARDAVKNGTKYDWHVGMVLLALAYGKDVTRIKL